MIELRHGYTVADLHALARLAVHTAGAMASNWHERYDTAWSAIAEALYAAPHWPQRRELVRAGQLAIYAEVDETRQAYGFYRRKTDGAVHGVASSPAFRTYWWDLCGARPSRSPERRVIEVASLYQILPLLAQAEREALVALAVHDDYTAAAAALGKSSTAFKTLVSRGRRRFLCWWHEGEQPSRPWGCDRRAGVTAGTRRADGVRDTLARRRRDAARRAAGHRQDEEA